MRKVCFMCQSVNLSWKITLQNAGCVFTHFCNGHKNIFCTARKMKFPIKDFFSNCDQIRRKLPIWSHYLKKSLMENFTFRAVSGKISKLPKLEYSILNYLTKSISSSISLSLFLHLISFFLINRYSQGS